MSSLNRREALRAFLRGALQSAGTVVLATTVLPAVAQASVAAVAAETPQVRADRLTTAAGQEAPQDGEEFCKFANGAFANSGFHNAGTHPVGGAFANHAAGGYGTFANAGTHPVAPAGAYGGSGSGGAFKNAAFRNY
jgi:hypothetical protein